MTPEIASWCMAVANVFRFSACVNSLCLSRTGRDDEIVFFEIEGPKCQRSQEHAKLMSPVQIWDILDETGMDGLPFE